MALTFLGQKLNVDIYLAAIFVFVWRMFNNLGIIRRYYIEKWTTKFQESLKKSEKPVEETQQNQGEEKM